PLRLLAVLRPARVPVHALRGQTDDLHVALVELRLELRHVAEFGRTDRSEVLWVREQDAPRVTEPFVKADLPLCGLGLEIWCGAADTKTHVRYLPGVNLRISQYEDAVLTSVSSRKNVAFAHPSASECAVRAPWRPRPAVRRRRR